MADLPYNSVMPRSAVELVDDTLALADAAGKLGVHVGTARRWVREGRFPCRTFRVGARHRVAVRDLNQLIEGA